MDTIQPAKKVVSDNFGRFRAPLVAESLQE
jgi:hypothetical protein